MASCGLTALQAMVHSNPKARIQSLEFAKEDVLELKLISSA